jgi:hypothetical protein
MPAKPARYDFAKGLHWVFDSDQRWALIGGTSAFILGCYLRAGEESSKVNEESSDPKK